MNVDYVADADSVADTPLRVAAVGLEHDEIYGVLERLRQHDDADLVAIAERSGRLRMAAAGRYRVPVFPRLTPLLAETTVDAVIVATANGDKSAAIEEALRAGKHVIAHAPCAITPEQLEAVKAAQPAAGSGLVLLLPHRFTPAYVQLREAIQQGLLGAISQTVIVNSQKVSATPRTQAFYATRTHGGVITNLAVHDLDVLRWLGGELTVTEASTRCHGATEHADFEDAGLIRCSLAEGGEGVVACNWLAPEAGAPFHELTVIGTAGSAWLSSGKLRAFGLEAQMPLASDAGPRVSIATRDDAGRTLLPRNSQSENDSTTAMLDAILTTLGDHDARRTATGDALRTTELAVQAQDIAWQSGA